MIVRICGRGRLHKFDNNLTGGEGSGGVCGLAGSGGDRVGFQGPQSRQIVGKMKAFGTVKYDGLNRCEKSM